MTGPITVSTDVAVVGYGPIGQTLVNLLAQYGRSVTVIERHPQPYPMPRATSFDGESARILASAGINPDLGPDARPTGDYGWQNADGLELLLFTGLGDIGPQGWPVVTTYYQPAMEAALIARGERLPGVRVLRGHEAVDFTDDGTGVTLVAEDAAGNRVTVRAHYLVGCDGANSVVRERLGVGFTELGFSHDWLTCDVTLHEAREFEPDNLQICDPARPRTLVPAGPDRRRFEFMRVPGETLDELNSTDKAWELLALEGVTPENATLDRHSVYTFKAGHAAHWRVGRVLLAGDAAHLMPPFAGQGMASGFRDAANLAWKLRLVLRGQADERILDTYTTERRAHVQYAITKSVELGQIICEPDPEAARERDKEMLAAKEQEGGSDGLMLEIRPLAEGLLHRPGEGGTGHLFPQGNVVRPAADGAAAARGRFDEVVGTGFVLLSLDPPDELLDDERTAFLTSLGTRVVQVLPADAAPPAEARDGVTVVLDADRIYLPHLTELSARTVLVRPDFYVFGTAQDRAGTADLVDALRIQLNHPERGRA